MLKNFAMILAVFAVLTSCSAVKNVSPEEIAAAYEGNFSAEGVLCFDDIECKAKLKKAGDEICLSVFETGNISEIFAETDGKIAEVGYDELSVKFDFDDLPEKMPLKLFYSFISELTQPKRVSFSFSEKEITANGENFSAVLSADDFSLLRVDFRESGVKFFAEKFAFFDTK